MAVQHSASLQTHPKFEKLSFKYESQFSVDSGMSSCPSTPSTPTSPIDFEIRVATIDDKPQIRAFLDRFFFRDEPLNYSTQLVADGEPISEELEEFSLKDLDNGANIVVLHDAKLVGVTLNKILMRDSDESPPVIKDEKFRKIVDLLCYVEQEAAVFEKFPDADRAMSVNILSVDTTYRGKGIAKTLMAKTRELAKEKGCGFMTVECTSHFTAMALARLGFDLHYSLNYSDYKPEGNVIFCPAPPHKTVTVYTQKL